MLSDDPVLDRRYIVEIFVAATYLRIGDLQAHCWQYFDDPQYYDEDSACMLYVETHYHPALDVVRNVMLTRINKFLLTFVATKDFLDLPLSHLMFLLSSDRICVNTEIEVGQCGDFEVILYVLFLGIFYSCSMAGSRLEQEKCACAAPSALYSVLPDAAVVSSICAARRSTPVGKGTDFPTGSGS